MYQYIKIRLLSQNCAMFAKQRDASTPKWCVHTILPLGPRAKQSDLHVHAKYTLQDVTATLTHCLHWAVELARFVLAAGGGERSARNMLWLLFSFMLGLLGKGGGGEPLIAWTCQKLPLMLRVTTWANNAKCACGIVPFLQPCAWNLLWRTYILDLNKRTENFLKFWQNSFWGPEVC
jgi:hypothetical protein